MTKIEWDTEDRKLQLNTLYEWTQIRPRQQNPGIALLAWVLTPIFLAEVADTLQPTNGWLVIAATYLWTCPVRFLTFFMCFPVDIYLLNDTTWLEIRTLYYSILWKFYAGMFLAHAPLIFFQVNCFTNWLSWGTT